MLNSDDGLVPVVMEAGFDPFRARVAMGGFLAGYSGKTFDAYALDLRQWSQWCLHHGLDLFEVRRAHIELFARWLEETGRPSRRWRGGCPRSQASTGTAPKNN